MPWRSFVRHRCTSGTSRKSKTKPSGSCVRRDVHGRRSPTLSAPQSSRHGRSGDPKMKQSGHRPRGPDHFGLGAMQWLSLQEWSPSSVLEVRVLSGRRTVFRYSSSSLIRIARPINRQEARWWTQPGMASRRQSTITGLRRRSFRSPYSLRGGCGKPSNANAERDRRPRTASIREDVKIGCSGAGHWGSAHHRDRVPA